MAQAKLLSIAEAEREKAMKLNDRDRKWSEDHLNKRISPHRISSVTINGRMKYGGLLISMLISKDNLEAFLLRGRIERELRVKVSEFEKCVKDFKEKYVIVFLEIHANLEWAKELKQDLEKSKEEKEYLQVKIDVLLGNAYDFRRSRRTDFEQLKENSGLKSTIHELEKTLESERKESDEEAIKQSKIEQELVNKIRKAEFELNAEKNSQGNKNKEFEELTEKLSKSESELTRERNLLKKKKDEIIEAKKNWILKRKILEKEKEKMIEVEKKFGVERISYENKINSLELNA
ncbi:stress response protein NST1-like [Cynara cardunculus var. scolymus]|uniref:stress response protein NST1-like n=1 Tax=Cynara cardunculus var. scolymus TaxID=59895 RepID=UPI000D62EF11|nr:stress response protein NST1-like [Cynara cardunculus var. scolymus]